MENLLSGLKAFAIFGSWVWAAIIVGVLLIALFVSEKEEDGIIAFVAMLGFVLLNYMFGNIPLLKLVTWSSVGVYFGLGLIFAMIRVYFYGRKMALNNNELKTYYLKENVFRWWFIWPISLLTWVFSDLLGDFWAIIYDKVSHTFEHILKLGFNSVKPVEKK